MLLLQLETKCHWHIPQEACQLPMDTDHKTTRLPRRNSDLLTPQKKQGLVLDMIIQIHRSIWYFQRTLEWVSLLLYEDKHAFVFALQV